MLNYLVFFAITCFVGLVVLGHVLLLQALLASTDEPAGKREGRRLRRKIIPDHSAPSPQ